MSAFFVSLIAFLAMIGHSNGAYCVCKEGVGDAQLQKNIDYACGNGADCNPILQNGACYNPNTVKDHCHWAVNSYYQRKGQAGASCDFSGTATLSQTAPSQSSSCSFPASPGNAGTVSGTPTTTPGTGMGTTTPGTGTGTTTPGTGMGAGAGTGMGTGTGTGMGTGMGGTPTTTIPGTTAGGSFGLAPTGTGVGYGDGSSATQNFHLSTLSVSISLSLLSLGLLFTRA